jgi:hypothetical protein
VTKRLPGPGGKRERSMGGNLDMFYDTAPRIQAQVDVEGSNNDEKRDDRDVVGVKRQTRVYKGTCI